MAEVITRNLGVVTAYKYAQLGGYTGTEAEFEALLANVATYSSEAMSAAELAAASLTDAEEYRNLAESYAVGTDGEARSGDATDNAKYYYELAEDSATTAVAAAEAASGSEETIQGYATTASDKSDLAVASATAAAESERNAALSEDHASGYESTASSAAESALNSKNYAQSYAIGTSGSVRAGDATDNAKYYKEQAASSATTAVTKAGEASASAANALSYKNTAVSAKDDAEAAATAASNSALTASAAEGYANTAESYAIGTSGTVRPGDATDNAKYYKEQAALSAGDAAQSALDAAGSASSASDLVAEALADIEVASDVISSADDAVRACENVEAELDLKLDKANVTRSNAVNTEGYAIDAREANPDVEGSLAYQIEHVMDVLPFGFGINNGVYGYIKEGESTVTPFRNPTGDAIAANVLSGKTFANSASDSNTGTMANRGAVSQSLNCGESYTVPIGYHNGSGTVTANSLASQTGVDAGKTAAGSGQVLTGYQAWVNGEPVTGTMANQGKKTQALNCGGSYTIPEGYHDGTGAVTANSLASQTGVDSGKTAAAAGQILTGYQAWANGSKVTGNMTNRGATTYTLAAGGTYTIPEGYHNGNGAVGAKTLAEQMPIDSGKTAATATQILTGYQAYVAGSKVSGSMANNGTVNTSLNCGNSYTIPAGYHSGSGKVTANTLASQTSADSGYSNAGNAQILSGYQAWSNGTKRTGSMATLTSSNFTGAHSSSTAGAASTYTVTSSKAGYVANGTAVNTLTAGTSATIATTAATGTKTINCVPGYYNKITVNQTNA